MRQVTGTAPSYTQTMHPAHRYLAPSDGKWEQLLFDVHTVYKEETLYAETQIT